MAVRIVFIVCSVLSRGRVDAWGRSERQVRLYDGEELALFQSDREGEMTEETAGNSAAEASRRNLSPSARRALAEAEARRAAYRAAEAACPREIGGRGGKEPGRYGDWEVKGLASDF
jgi:hypothetical protein